MKQGVKWICRAIVESPYCIGLCLEEEMFKKELKRLNVPRESWPLWIPKKADARVHTFEKTDTNDVCAIVCVRYKEGLDPNQVVGIIVHEAVHVWQEICERIGEYEPSKEFEAYSVQSIAQRLIATYSEMSANLKKKK